MVVLAALTTACQRAEEPRGVAAAVAPHPAAHPALLYGRVTMKNGETYRGRLRFGGDEEAFWGDYFYGVKKVNPWVEHVAPGELPIRRARILGLPIGPRRPDVGRPFLARFGDIAKLEADGSNLWVTMRSGTVHHLDRYAADDFADGVRVWDDSGLVLDLGERRVRTIEFMHPVQSASEAPYRLHGTVHTAQGEFTGFIQWGRRGSVALDELVGHAPDGERVRIPFATIRSIARDGRERSRVTLLDGRELVLSGTRQVGQGHLGHYVDDARYGRVLVSWAAFERVDFTPAGGAGTRGGPSYGEFATGAPLEGTVVTLDGARHSGRLVFDLDESETTETLDAPLRGIHYTLALADVRSIVLPGGGARTPDPARVLLRSGVELKLERADDLGPGNAGMLIFPEGGRPTYVPWRDVAQVDFGGAPAAVTLH